MKFALGVLGVSALASTAFSQGLAVKAGYYSGESFSGNGGASVRLEGLELGTDLTLLKLPLTPVEVRLSPSVVFGGSLRKGGDEDGTLYRLLATARVSQPRLGAIRKRAATNRPTKPRSTRSSGSYLTGGLGFARVEPRGGSPFESKDGWIAQVGFGSSVANVPSPVPQPFFEVSYTFGETEFRGFTVSLGVRL